MSKAIRENKFCVGSVSGSSTDLDNSVNYILDRIIDETIRPVLSKENGIKIYQGFTNNSFNFTSFIQDKDGNFIHGLRKTVETYQEPYCNVWFGEYQGRFWEFTETEGDITIYELPTKDLMIQQTIKSQKWFDKNVKG